MQTSLIELSICALHKAIKEKKLLLGEEEIKKILPEEILEKFVRYGTVEIV